MFNKSSEETGKVTSNVSSSFKKMFKTEDVPNYDLELHQRRSQPSTSQSQPEQAVYVRDAYKRYGMSINPVVVLDGFNMTVPKGAIYALLGSSGCGKTTLLSCILNQRKLNSGKIWILGGMSGSKNSGVPGPRVGYMPQETSLYGDFTIDETLVYYGWVLGLSNKKIKERSEFLKQLLMLPETNQFVNVLSGGQRRRVSLASALLHEPELLILDEPTVGVDPLLRQTIWKHFVDISQGGNTTIILTTHYIEEARQAHVVGLMREGCLLAEESPEKLLIRFHAKTLEDVFLKLSVKQNKWRQFNITNDIAVPVNDLTLQDGIYPALQTFDLTLNEDEKIISLPEMPRQEVYHTKCSEYLPNIKYSHMKALIWKGFLWMMRNIIPMSLVIMLPVSQIIVFCFAIGRDPKDISIAVVNRETNNNLHCNKILTCDSIELSCSYFGYLQNRSFDLIYYDSEQLARESVLKGHTFASIFVRRNYSTALRVRIDDGETTDPWNTIYSEIDVFRDFSNKHIATHLKVQLYETFQMFIQDYVETCGINRKYLKVPIKWETPIYGEKRPDFTEFALPGILMILTFFLAVAATAFGLLIERNEGSFERTFVIGITEVELLIAHIICQFVIMVSQGVLSLVCTFAIFDMTLKGSIWLLTMHTMLTGFCGMCYGLLVSCVCDREETAMFLALGSVLPLIFLCGTIWPVEAIHPLLKPIAYVLPLTQGTESLRSMLQRGWGITSETVYLGFIILSLWTVGFLAVSIVFLKLKKSEFTSNVLPVLINKLFFFCNIK